MNLHYLRNYLPGKEQVEILVIILIMEIDTGSAVSILPKKLKTNCFQIIQ